MDGYPRLVNALNRDEFDAGQVVNNLVNQQLNYMVRLRLRELAAEKGIKNLYTALIKGGISHDVAIKYMKGDKDRMVVNHIEKLCLTFRCMPNDLFIVTPDKPELADLTQPVYKLAPREDFNIAEKLKHMTPDEVKARFASE